MRGDIGTIDTQHTGPKHLRNDTLKYQGQLIDYLGNQSHCGCWGKSMFPVLDKNVREALPVLLRPYYTRSIFL